MEDCSKTISQSLSLCHRPAHPPSPDLFPIRFIFLQYFLGPFYLFAIFSPSMFSFCNTLSHHVVFFHHFIFFSRHEIIAIASLSRSDPPPISWSPPLPFSLPIANPHLSFSHLSFACYSVHETLKSFKSSPHAFLLPLLPFINWVNQINEKSKLL